MKKTKSLPAIIMLVAGLIDCIFSIYYHLSLWEFTRQLLLVLIIFYLIGCVVAIVIDINFKAMEEEDAKQAEAEEPLDPEIEKEPEEVDISKEEEESEDTGDSKDFEEEEETAESA
jgi:flagellar biosynthesis/type III secretory pathway M-ring protein FliF/YscJ